MQIDIFQSIYHRRPVMKERPIRAKRNWRIKVALANAAFLFHDEVPSFSLRFSFFLRRSMRTTWALSVVYVWRNSRSLSCNTAIRWEASNSGSVKFKIEIRIRWFQYEGQANESITEICAEIVTRRTRLKIGQIEAVGSHGRTQVIGISSGVFAVGTGPSRTATVLSSSAGSTTPRERIVAAAPPPLVWWLVVIARRRFRQFLSSLQRSGWRRRGRWWLGGRSNYRSTGARADGPRRLQHGNRSRVGRRRSICVVLRKFALGFGAALVIGR